MNLKSLLSKPKSINFNQSDLYSFNHKTHPDRLVSENQQMMQLGVCAVSSNYITPFESYWDLNLKWE
jgi:hypothetical protein